ncbi:hypothetical protein [Stutzerimonas kunmingensis]|uniref:hypothetical protein n=1 Tax=Stutzerimonas kunmingensis TaxID=1211807 RepID=UPI0028ABFB97|nr:hypothetical protein [Stutzerimonas kunmingensis]
MTDIKARMARIAERSKKRRLYLEAEARKRGVDDVDGYVRAVLEMEDGPLGVDDMPDDPLLPIGQSLH